MITLQVATIIPTDYEIDMTVEQFHELMNNYKTSESRHDAIMQLLKNSEPIPNKPFVNVYLASAKTFEEMYSEKFPLMRVIKNTEDETLELPSDSREEE